ncbi:type III pantothenate kinase [Desulfobaculum xiamenense]|uniref:Type III pantothenate kinase n=1 Tax=Desulfobaculum xiamenense TaxID=995050 RepID=A0A846QT13_9BACT|nr:type III pantothenate kinase [Desulfobaculum xiamenense]NJB68595.1 type III pantothenate kinase [Desulfobaculum xiamenense]
MSTSHSLLLDIGNTNTKIALWSPEAGERPAAVATVPTLTDSADEWAARLLHVARQWDIDTRTVADVAACSVVPAASEMLDRAARKAFGLRARLAPDTLAIAFDNIDDVPDNVGPDRIVAAFGARRSLAALNVIVLDFGTATTVDCVRGNTYLGGVICPGMRTAASALTDRTARLPELTFEIDSPKLAFGFDTMRSLNQGFIFGFAALAEGLISRMTDALGGPAAVIATGGLAPIVATVCPALDDVRPDLIFTGLVHACMEG